jgi:DNA adenine methylase
VTNKILNPVIKWSGSKRALAPTILPLIPKSGNYFEPFIGGGSILGNIGPRKSFASDILPELIDLWEAIKTQPDFLAHEYLKMWNRLQAHGHEVYYEVRDIFNERKSPEHFLFLTRTCVNGLIRFNSAGEFNNSLHHSRPGIHPDRLALILNEWSKRVSQTVFINCDFTETINRCKKNDIVYLDPPYMNNKGRYSKATFDFQRLWDSLEELNRRSVKWILSIDGSSGSRDYSTNLETPRSLASVEFNVAAGNSPFPRLQKSRTDEVFESIFMNFEI